MEPLQDVQMPDAAANGPRIDLTQPDCWGE